jgi:hypothetical protein
MLLAQAGSPLNGFTGVLVVLAFFGPFWLAATVVAVTAILARRNYLSRRNELSSELIHQMLQREMPVDEIERVIVAWSQDRKAAKAILASQQSKAPPPKPKW